MTCTQIHAGLLSRRKSAEYIGKSMATLERWAMTKKNFDYQIIDGEAYYKITDLHALLKFQQTF